MQPIWPPGLREILDDPRVRSNFYAHGIIAGTANALTRSENLLGSLIKNRGRLVEAMQDAAGPQTPLRAFINVPPAPAVAAPAAAQQAAAQQAGAQQAAVQTPQRQPGIADSHLSYIASSDFALALLGSLDPHNPVPGMDEVTTSVRDLPDSNLKTALLVALSTAGTDVDKLRSNIANWFDNSMDRLSGAYKRNLKFISIIIGLAVAVIFNADTLKVGTTLWTDNALRAQIVQAAQGMIQKTPQPAASTDQTQSLKSLEDAFTEANNHALPLPIGWKCTTAEFPACLETGIGWWTPVGWFITGLAFSLGAPFWFDLLSMFMNLRGAGVKPKREDAN